MPQAPRPVSTVPTPGPFTPTSFTTLRSNQASIALTFSTTLSIVHW